MVLCMSVILLIIESKCFSCTCYTVFYLKVYPFFTYTSSCKFVAAHNNYLHCKLLLLHIITCCLTAHIAVYEVLACCRYCILVEILSTPIPYNYFILLLNSLFVSALRLSAESIWSDTAHTSAGKKTCAQS